MNPQFDLNTDDPGGDTSKKKKRNAPHYKDLYEAQKAENETRMKLNTSIVAAAIVGWFAFACALVTIIILISQK
jgi:hypothetical protein